MAATHTRRHAIAAPSGPMLAPSLRLTLQQAGLVRAARARPLAARRAAARRHRAHLHHLHGPPYHAPQHFSHHQHTPDYTPATCPQLTKYHRCRRCRRAARCRPPRNGVLLPMAQMGMVGSNSILYPSQQSHRAPPSTQRTQYSFRPHPPASPQPSTHRLRHLALTLAPPSALTLTLTHTLTLTRTLALSPPIEHHRAPPNPILLTPPPSGSAAAVDLPPPPSRPRTHLALALTLRPHSHP